MTKSNAENAAELLQHALDGTGPALDRGTAVIMDAARTYATLALVDAVREARVPATLDVAIAGRAYKVGDDDPTPDSTPWCSADSPDFEYVCTWRPGHTGPHIAGGFAKIQAVWP